MQFQKAPSHLASSVVHVLKNANTIFSSTPKQSIITSFNRLLLGSEISIEVKANLLDALSLMLVTFRHSAHHSLIFEIFSAFFNSVPYKRNSEYFSGVRLHFCENILIYTRKQALHSPKPLRIYLDMLEQLFIKRLLFEPLVESVLKSLQIDHFGLNFLIYLECKYLGGSADCRTCRSNLASGARPSSLTLCSVYLRFLSGIRVNPLVRHVKRDQSDWIIWDVIGRDSFKILKHFTFKNIRFNIPFFEENLLHMINFRMHSDPLWNRSVVGNRKPQEQPLKQVDHPSDDHKDQRDCSTDENNWQSYFLSQMEHGEPKAYETSLKVLHTRILGKLSERDVTDHDYFGCFFVYFCYHFRPFRDLVFARRLEIYVWLVKNIKSLDTKLKGLSLKLLMMCVPHEPEVLFENLLIKRVFSKETQEEVPKKHLMKTCQLISSNNNRARVARGEELQVDRPKVHQILETIFGRSHSKNFMWDLTNLKSIEDRLLNCFCNNSYLFKNYYNFNENSFFEEDTIGRFLISDDKASVQTSDTFRNTTKSTFEKLYFKSTLGLTAEFDYEQINVTNRPFFARRGISDRGWFQERFFELNGALYKGFEDEKALIRLESFSILALFVKHKLGRRLLTGRPGRVTVDWRVSRRARQADADGNDRAGANNAVQNLLHHVLLLQ